ncbi:cadmium-translocating P-type ATPase [Brevibacterium sp. 5221]|uniref:Cadmium-translocating P-type ATPase n=1 Tax=Brevibacterium rongguiense TaxID=2695267 RepID=A0A6N9H7M8_9MICO|nr:cadmium-translocating P-type ATPase [Brevibacterium rongguiense]
MSHSDPHTARPHGPGHAEAPGAAPASEARPSGAQRPGAEGNRHGGGQCGGGDQHGGGAQHGGNPTHGHGGGAGAPGTQPGHQHDHGHDDQHSRGDHHGHGGHHDHVAMFRRLFWTMLALAVPVVGCSPMFAQLVGYEIPAGPLAWVSPVLGTVMYAWGGRPFLTGAASELRARRPGMMLLIALAITVAFASSWGAALGLLDPGLDFWWELALLIVIMLLGHWIEMRSLAQTSSALDSLAALLPEEAERAVPGRDGETTERVAPAALRVGDTVIVRPGAAVPADGEVVDGSAHLDESMITGESRPVVRSAGDRVVAGTVAQDSGLRVRVTATGDDTALAGIQGLVAQAQQSSSRTQALADRAAGWLFWFALGAAVVTALVWALGLGRPDEAVVRTVTVLVIACPHALGLAIPLVISIATERAARAGVLIRDRLALEAMRTVSTVVFDKTGTLTRGEPAVTDIATASDGASPGADEVLRLAAAAESDSEHPLARAIVAAAQERGLTIPQFSDFSSRPAVGVQARVDGARVQVGGPALLADAGAQPLTAAHDWSADGATVLHVLANGRVIGALELADDVRPESAEAVAALHREGIGVVMITGDAQEVAEATARGLGIDRVFAGVAPADKEKHIAALQADGHRVAMVGDGVNDAPALARADVGIAIGAGTDVAIASAGVILASSDPRAVLSVFELSRRAYRKMVENLWWAAGYNLIAVPLAAGVLAPIGFLMPMSAGALLMSASTVVVAANAQLLRRLDLDPAAVTARILDGSSGASRANGPGHPGA